MGAATAPAILILFDAAAREFRSRAVSREALAGIDRIECLGFPSLAPTADARQLAATALGVPVDPWPDSLTESEIAGVFAEATTRSAEMDATWGELLPASDIPWSRLKANDRVYYRLIPLAKLESLLRRALTLSPGRTVLVPWVGDRFDLVERNGMLGLDAPGHQVVAMINRLSATCTFDLRILWPGRERREPRAIALSTMAMAAARAVRLLQRRWRDVLSPSPAGDVRVSDAGRAAVGYVVWGTSQWSSLRPLIEAGRDRHQPVVIGADIFRHPSSYRALMDAKQPFVPVDALLSIWKTVATLVAMFVRQWRLRRTLRRAAGRTSDVVTQETLMVPAADLASLPELALYVRQLEVAITRYRLAAVVSANNIDAFLGATTVAAERAGIPHICIHNTALERVPLPAYADCDLYVTDSESYADYLRTHGAKGRVEALGLPTYDSLVTAAGKKGRGEVFQAFPHLAGRKVVGVTTQTSWIDFSPLLEALVRWAESRSDVAVVIKLHPREDADAYEAFARRLQDTGRGGRLHHVGFTDFLCDCDCLVAGASTTLFWATVMGVRPFSWAEQNIKLMAAGLDYLAPEITTASTTPDGVVAAVDAYLREVPGQDAWFTRREHYLAHQLTGTDGQACQRILSRIDELAGIVS